LKGREGGGAGRVAKKAASAFRGVVSRRPNRPERRGRASWRPRGPTAFQREEGAPPGRGKISVNIIVLIFEIRRLSKYQDMLSIEISRDNAVGTITTWQCAKARALAAVFLC
jgi:hypothetical protein